MSSNNKNSIYIGVTNELKRRVLQHKSKELKGFSNKYNCVNLVYFVNIQYLYHIFRNVECIIVTIRDGVG